MYQLTFLQIYNRLQSRVTIRLNFKTVDYRLRLMSKERLKRYSQNKRYLSRSVRIHLSRKLRGKFISVK